MVITAPAAAPPVGRIRGRRQDILASPEKVFADALEGCRACQFGALNRWKACKDTQEAERNRGVILCDSLASEVA